MTGRGEVEIGPGLEHIQQHRAKAQRLPGALRGAGLLQQGQALTEPLQLLWLLHSHAPKHPLLGAQQVHSHRHGGADHIFKQQGRSASGQDPVGNRCQLQIWIHRGADAPQPAPLLQEVDEAAQIPATALTNSLIRHGLL